MIVIIDFGMGNLGSIKNMLEKIGTKVIISSKSKDIEKADKLILPGVGAFDNAMNNLQKLNLIPILNKKVLEDKIPILGICLGMQLLMEKSEEGKLKGLRWIKGEVIKFKFKGNSLKTPHMGWNTLKILDKKSLFANNSKEVRFYFVHSYHVVCKNKENILATTNYGYDFTSAVHKGNIYGTQFHPEKSHKFGLKLLKNFIEL